MEISRWCEPPDNATQQSTAPAGAGENLTHTAHRIPHRYAEAVPQTNPVAVAARETKIEKQTEML